VDPEHLGFELLERALRERKRVEPELGTRPDAVKGDHGQVVALDYPSGERPIGS
jgi:hypothetical protein